MCIASTYINRGWHTERERKREREREREERERERVLEMRIRMVYVFLIHDAHARTRARAAEDDFLDIPDAAVLRAACEDALRGELSLEAGACDGGAPDGGGPLPDARPRPRELESRSFKVGGSKSRSRCLS